MTAIVLTWSCAKRNVAEFKAARRWNERQLGDAGAAFREAQWNGNQPL